jgi:DNA-binding response OmpR family regulator
MKVLVIDSSLDRAKLIRDLLESYRYKTVIHSNGGQILNQIQNVKPSLVIVHSKDSGIQILERIKKDSRFLKIPVIMISSLSSDDAMNRIRKYPNVDFLVEPFKIKNFRHAVQRWINFRSLYV